MIITERERLALVKSLEGVLGQHDAATLMEYLPAQGWREVATKTDLDNLRLELKVEIADLRTETTAGLADLRTELRTGVADVKVTIARLEAGLEKQLRRQLMWIVGTMISLIAILAVLSLIKH